MRKMKKVDIVKKVINYNVDELIKTDGDIKEQELARRA